MIQEGGVILKIKKLNIFMMALTICSLFIFPAKQAYAKDLSIDVNIPVKQEFISQETISDCFNTTGVYILESINPNTPMPRDCIGQTYEFKLNGKETNSDIKINYTHAGVFEYKLYQKTSVKEYYIYDNSEYIITVYVKNTNDGKLLPQIVVKNEQGDKSIEAVFKNTYCFKQQDNSHSPETGNKENLSILGLTLAFSVSMLIVLSNKNRENRVKSVL